MIGYSLYCNYHFFSLQKTCIFTRYILVLIREFNVVIITPHCSVWKHINRISTLSPLSFCPLLFCVLVLAVVGKIAMDGIGYRPCIDVMLEKWECFLSLDDPSVSELLHSNEPRLTAAITSPTFCGSWSFHHAILSIPAMSTPFWTNS